LLKSGGTAGLLATNTIAQGDTREVGLDQMTAHGTTIYRAIPSRKWPGEANLDVAHVWFRKGTWDGLFLLDDAAVVSGITGSCKVPGRIGGKPTQSIRECRQELHRILRARHGLCTGAGQRRNGSWTRSRAIAMCYSLTLGGEDLNSRWDQSPSRWVINFHDWPLERASRVPGLL
jgi:hypothetical protein